VPDKGLTVWGNYLSSFISFNPYHLFLIYLLNVYLPKKVGVGDIRISGTKNYNL
jgi:hypothetical protein